jgi:hypothetical protein
MVGLLASEIINSSAANGRFEKKPASFHKTGEYALSTLATNRIRWVILFATWPIFVL